MPQIRDKIAPVWRLQIQILTNTVISTAQGNANTNVIRCSPFLSVSNIHLPMRRIGTHTHLQDPLRMYRAATLCPIAELSVFTCRNERPISHLSLFTPENESGACTSTRQGTQMCAIYTGWALGCLGACSFLISNKVNFRLYFIYKLQAPEHPSPRIV